MENSNQQKWNRRKGIMLAYPFEEKRLLKWKPPYIVQPKLDGERCRAVPVASGEYVLLSSEENVIYSAPHVNEALNKMFLNSLNPPELDGELYCHGMNFERIHSIIGRKKNLTDSSNIAYHIFDVVDCARSQAERLCDLLDMPICECEYAPLRFVPCEVKYSLEGVLETYRKYVDNGYEGIIVRNSHTLYARKRSIWMMKFKPKKADVYLVVGFQEEISVDGIPKNRLGSLLCVSESRSNEVFSVGTGMTENERRRLWQDKDNLIGKCVSIEYQHITQRGVPRFPVFVRLV